MTLVENTGVAERGGLDLLEYGDAGLELTTGGGNDVTIGLKEN